MIKESKFKPTKTMIEAAKTVFGCMALVNTIKPIVGGYQKKILQKHQFRNSEGVIITEPNKSWTMSDEDFKIYLAECNKERIKAGLHVENEEFCPLLVVENLLIKAKWALIDAAEPITKIKSEEIYNMEDREKLVELTLKLLASFVDNGIV